MKKLLFVPVLLLLFLALAPVMAQDAATLPALDELATGEWNRIVPGGDTICARGDEYSFFVRPGESDDLMIYFQGGGACWNGVNCEEGFRFPPDAEGPLFKEAVAEDESDSYNQGVFDFENADNPFADYSVVYVPYCTADVHTGDSQVEFEGQNGSYTINFNGVNNARSALNWAYENFTEPSSLFIAGGSAGAYGSIYHAADIMTNYEGVPATQLGDAGVGVTPRAWEGLGTWGLYDNLPDYIEELADVTPERYSIRLHYASTARAFPENQFGTDGVQIGFFLLQGGGASPAEAGANWVANSRSIMSGLQGSLNNFAGFTSGGSAHTILDTPDFYTYEVGDLRFRDWVADLLTSEASNILCIDCANADVGE
jgi:hypothetical protein